MFRKNYEEETELEREVREAKEEAKKAVKEAGLAWIDAIRCLAGEEDTNKKKK